MSGRSAIRARLAAGGHRRRAGSSVWVFPVIWGLLTSFKTERDVLAYPPVCIFKPTLDNYREVMFGTSSILPNLWSSMVVATAATLLTMLFAVPAAYALARLRYPAKRASGFYVLATQMLPPVGLIIPYYLAMQKIGVLDTYSGLTDIYLTFSLPFAIWLMVSYFEDVPLEMEEAALLDRAGRLRTLWYVILPQVRGGIAVTAIFVFLNAWNEFMFAVVLGGNRVRPVTVAMFNFISVEQTQWSRLAAGGDAGDGARHPDRHLRPAPHRQGADRRRRQGRRTAMSGSIVGSVRLEGVVKRHGATTVLHGIDLAIEPGEFFVLLGPFGLGQDHDAAHPGRAGIGERRPRADGRRRRHPARSPASATWRWCSRAMRSTRT